MTVSIAGAAAAYAKSGAGTGAPGMAPREPAGKPFADILRESVDAVTQSGRAAEQVSLQALAGEADMSDVVTAVSNAEIALQTLVAVRDRVVQAYQDIIRMPM